MERGMRSQRHELLPLPRWRKTPADPTDHRGPPPHPLVALAPSQIGNTPMIGLNDVETETFYLTDAHKVGRLVGGSVGWLKTGRGGCMPAPLPTLPSMQAATWALSLHPGSAGPPPGAHPHTCLTCPCRLPCHPCCCFRRLGPGPAPPLGPAGLPFGVWGGTSGRGRRTSPSTPPRYPRRTLSSPAS